MNVDKYTSDRVFEGKRVLTEEEAARHRERLKRALDKRKNDMKKPFDTL
jgi:hypothetical protein